MKIHHLTYEQLIEEGLHESNGEKFKGILLKIEKEEKSDKNNITLEISKYRSNEGSITVEVTAAYQEGQWRVVNHIPTKES